MRSRRAVLVHVTTVPMSLGFLTGQAAYMRAHGIEVMAISSAGDAVSAFERREDVPVHTVEMVRDITPLRDLGALWRIYRRFRETRPDIVHSHTPKGGLLGMVAAGLARVDNRVYHMRGLPHATASGLRRVLLRWTETVSCALAHTVICVSESARSRAVADGICPASKITVLGHGSGNGVDAAGRFNPQRVGTGSSVRESLGIPSEAVVVGFVGRIVRDKGVVELAEAWRLLRGEHMELHLLLVGPFEPRDAVPSHVMDVLKSDSRVHLTGPSSDTPALYAAMDLVVLPTYREGFPNVALEAAAMNLPIVATEVTGCVDAVIHEVTGLLVPARDTSALASAIRRYCRDSALRLRHGDAARARVLEKFRPEQIWAALLAEYNTLLDRAIPSTTQQEG